MGDQAKAFSYATLDGKDTGEEVYNSNQVPVAENRHPLPKKTSKKNYSCFSPC
jgi:hypothetical protein